VKPVPTQSAQRIGMRSSAWIVALTLLLATTQAAAEVRARVEPRVIDELETARLILRTSGRTVMALDLSALDADFEVLGTQTQSQYQSIGGVVEAWVEYQITVRPKRGGQLIVPALRIGDAVSAPLTLEVRPLDPTVRAAIDRMVFFEQSLTRERVYVGAETVLVRRLYYSSAAQIYSDLPAAPNIPDALVVTIGETRTGSLERNGEPYGVIEQRYAIFPQRPGTLTVPPISLTTSVRLQDGERVRRTGVRVGTEPVAVEVLPIPAEYPADVPWLPAIDLSLQEIWTPEPDRLTTGEPLARTIEVSVIGNLAAAISPVESSLPDAHFRQYPEPPELSDSRAGPSIVGTRRSAYAVLPTSPGTVSLPALTVTWWDVDAARVRVATVPARQVNIASAQTSAPPPHIEPTTPTEPAEAILPSTGPRTLAVDLVAWRARLLTSLPWLAGALLLAGGLHLIMRRRLAGQTQGGAIARWRSEAGRLVTLRRLRRRLRRRVRQGDPRAIETALGDYLCCWFGVTHTREALRRFRAAGHGAVLDALAAARFGPTPAAPANLSLVLAGALAALRHTRQPRVDALPPLYPSG